MITLSQLIQVAPFPEETKKDLLSKEDTLSEEKKVELEELCWGLISQWYQNELRSQQEMAALEVSRGEKQYTKEDFNKMADDLFSELVQKLDVQSSEEDLAEAREKLGAILHDQQTN